MTGLLFVIRHRWSVWSFYTPPPSTRSGLQGGPVRQVLLYCSTAEPDRMKREERFEIHKLFFFLYICFPNIGKGARRGASFGNMLTPISPSGLESKHEVTVEVRSIGVLPTDTVIKS